MSGAILPECKVQDEATAAASTSATGAAAAAENGCDEHANAGGGVMGSSAVSPGNVAPPAVVMPALPTPTPSHQASGIGLEPNTQTPPANVLQVVHQVQEEAARQQVPQGAQPGVVGALRQAPPGPGNPATQNAVLEQLLQTLRSPNTPEQQQQILQILKSNPNMMGAFIKQRQTFKHNFN